MYALVVAIAFLVNGDLQPAGSFTYKVEQWETKEACEAFVKSEAGQESLQQLSAYVALQAGGVVPVLAPVCKNEDERGA